MRVKLVGVVAAVAAVALAVFAATGFGGEGTDVRSLKPGSVTERLDVDDLRRVATPSGQAGTSAVAEASKKKGKVKFLFFETAQPVPAPAGGVAAFELECVKGKAVTGTFFPAADNTQTFLSASAVGTNSRRWLIRVTNASATPTQVVLGVVCATGVK